LVAELDSWSVRVKWSMHGSGTSELHARTECFQRQWCKGVPGTTSGLMDDARVTSGATEGTDEPDSGLAHRQLAGGSAQPRRGWQPGSFQRAVTEDLRGG
ncbi:unnamed protein product, partial [Polarella glacialis]